MQSTYQLAGVGPTRVEGELAALLLREGRHMQFAPGSLIQHHGDAGDGFWLVREGSVTICRNDAEGGTTVFAVLGPGDLFGELAYFTGSPRQADAVADREAVLVRVDTRLVERLLAEEPRFARWLLRSLGNQLSAALDRIERDRTLSAEDRLRQVLRALVRREGPVLELTQQALADLAGISRVTAGQVLGKLAQSGAIELGYRRIVVRTPGAAPRP